MGKGEDLGDICVVYGEPKDGVMGKEDSVGDIGAELVEACCDKSRYRQKSEVYGMVKERVKKYFFMENYVSRNENGFVL